MSQFEAFVYLWTDNKEKKFYIGVHKGKQDDGYVCSSKYVLKEYNERPHDFSREVLYTGTWKDMLCKEQALIKSHDAVNSPQYYNKSNGIGPFLWNVNGTETNPMLGKHHTPETREKMSAVQKERLKTETNPMLGKHHTPETREKMSAVQKERLKSPEARARISRGLKKCGPEILAERLAKMREGLRDPGVSIRRTNSIRIRMATPETRARVSAAQKGKKRKSPSLETRTKMSAALKGRRHSTETRAKMSTTRLAIFAARRAAKQTNLQSSTLESFLQ